MNVDLIKSIYEEANNKDFIEVYVFNEPIVITKEEYFIDTYCNDEIIAIIKRSGDIEEIYIDPNSIKYIKIAAPKKIGTDFRDI